MRITNPKYFDPIEIEENPETLIIEDGKMFRQTVNELIAQIQTGVGDFVLYDNGAIRELGRDCMIITDEFQYMGNSRQIKSKLQQLLAEEINGNQETTEVISAIIKFGIAAGEKTTYPITFNTNLSASDIIKLLDIDVDTSEMSDLEKMIEYLKLCKDFLKFKFVILINAKDIMNDTEYNEFNKTVRYLKIPLLMIERHVHSGVDDKDHTRIIDSDLCVI